MILLSIVVDAIDRPKRYCTNIGVNLGFEVNSRRLMLKCPQRDNLTINDRYEELVSKTQDRIVDRGSRIPQIVLIH
jgi:hypothetical protein